MFCCNFFHFRINGCFQERLDYAVYVDAHVMEIQRRLHDINGCRCIFVIRFDDDKTEVIDFPEHMKIRLDFILFPVNTELKIILLFLIRKKINKFMAGKGPTEQDVLQAKLSSRH